MLFATDLRAGQWAQFRRPRAMTRTSGAPPTRASAPPNLLACLWAASTRAAFDIEADGTLGYCTVLQLARAPARAVGPALPRDPRGPSATWVLTTQPIKGARVGEPTGTRGPVHRDQHSPMRSTTGGTTRFVGPGVPDEGAHSRRRCGPGRPFPSRRLGRLQYPRAAPVRGAPAGNTSDAAKRAWLGIQLPGPQTRRVGGTIPFAATPDRPAAAGCP